MLLVFSLFSGLLYLAAPLAIDAVVSNLAFGTEQKPYLQALVALSLALFAFLLVQAVVRGFQHYVAEIIQRRIFVRTATDLAHRLPRLNSAALDEIHAPEMVNRFMEVVTAQKTTALLLLDGINLVFSCATGLVLLALYHPVLLAFAAILFTLLTIVLLALGRGAIPTSIRESLFKYQLVHWFEQIAANPVLFKSRGGLALASSKASTLIHSYLESRSSHFRILMRQIAGLLSLQVLSSAALLGVGGWLVISQQLTLGQLVASEIIMTSIVTSLGKLGKKLEAWYDVMAAMDKLGHMFDLPVESTSGETPTVHTPPSIETHGLVVTSPAGKPVTMPDIVLQPGQKASLTANEGEPASLLADVLFGLRPQSSGSARINGLDIRDWNLANLRAHTLLLRPLEIVEGSIADNLRLGNEEIGPDEMLRALLLSGLTADGSLRLSSPLKLGGYPLTPLQRARLLTARALVQKPHLLLLDRVFDGLHQNDARFLLSLLLEAEHPWTIISSAQSDLPHPGWTLHLNINA
jgi:ABC-type bacteriocin/lantibiotic exporter with double-glycine peptidase domain